MDVNEVLKIAIQLGASDTHLKVGMPPIVRINGALYPLKDYARLPAEEIAQTAFNMMNTWQREKFKDSPEIDLAYSVSGLGRFRVNIFQQRGTIGIVFRIIPHKIRDFAELNLPPILDKLSQEQRGLILVTGTTGSGKSTTLAAMVDTINSKRTCHIVTIEDPIEFLIRDKRSIIDQREVGFDTQSFGVALRSALRQDPDVILVGEMRDLETIETALIAAETGHLVLSTLHTVDATETITRVVSIFPPYQQKQVRLQLSAVLKGVISQRLIARADGKGRVPAVEIMVNTARIRELIEDKDRTKEIPNAIAGGHVSYSMQTFDQSLMVLLKQGLVTYDEAMRQSSNPDDFALRIKGVAGTSDYRWDGFEDAGQKQKEAGKADDFNIERF